MGEVFAGPGFRACSKPGCGWPAVATLGFDYEARTAWVGDLSAVEDPSAYDLCAVHSSRFKVPRDWSFTDSRAEDGGEAPIPAVDRPSENRSLIDDWPEAVSERNEPSPHGPRSPEPALSREHEEPADSELPERQMPQASTAGRSAQTALLDF